MTRLSQVCQISQEVNRMKAFSRHSLTVMLYEPVNAQLLRAKGRRVSCVTLAIWWSARFV